jgi:uncharacterized protein YjdB
MKRNTVCGHRWVSFFLALAMIALPMIIPVASHAQTKDLVIVNYVKLSEKRITRTVYEYTYRADVTNSGPAVLNVAAIATNNSSHTTIIDNTLSFGDVPAGTTVTSSDTFIFRHDRSYAFSWSNLSWNIQYEISIGNTLSVGLEGGTLHFPNGVILDIPAGAVNELVDIKITNLSCEEVDAIILSQQQLATHQKRCLRGFSAEPHGLVFNTPIKAFVPVSLEPGEIPVRIEVDMNSHVQWTINAELVYWGNDGFIEMSLEHFSEEWLAALLNFREQTCKRCDTYIPYIDGQFWCGPLYDPSPVFDGLQPGACQLLNTRPLPPETKTEREKCAPGVRCCMEELMEIEVTEADFTSGQCQLVGAKLTATFPTCDEPNTITESLSESAGCPEDMDFEITIVSDQPWIYACQQANLKAELTGISKDGKVLFEAATFPADWEIIIGDPNVAQLGADIPPNGKIVQGGQEEGDVLIRASAIGAENKIFADYALTVVSNIRSFILDPDQETIKVGDGRILIAEIIGAEGNILDPSTVTWSSNDPSIAYLIQDTGGWTSVEGRDCGTVIITARYQYDCETILTTAEIAVEKTKVTVTPNQETLLVDKKKQLTATVTDCDGNPYTECTLEWYSDNTEVAQVTNAGLVTGISSGVAVIMAVCGDAIGVATIEVSEISIEVQPAQATIDVGGTTLLTATVKDEAGDPYTGCTVRWYSNNLGVATVTRGTVTGISVGVAEISAVCDDEVGFSTVTVVDPNKPLYSVVWRVSRSNHSSGGCQLEPYGYYFCSSEGEGVWEGNALIDGSKYLSGSSNVHYSMTNHSTNHIGIECDSSETFSGFEDLSGETAIFLEVIIDGKPAIYWYPPGRPRRVQNVWGEKCTDGYQASWTEGTSSWTQDYFGSLSAMYEYIPGDQNGKTFHTSGQGPEGYWGCWERIRICAEGCDWSCPSVHWTVTIWKN